jgi:hypothetical protein
MMMYLEDTIEVRVQYDREQPWEDIEPVTLVVGTRGQPLDDGPSKAAAMFLLPGVWEVRWNWTGSLQGHYVPGERATVYLFGLKD